MVNLVSINRTDGGISIMNIEDGYEAQEEVNKWEEGYKNSKRSLGVKCASWRAIKKKDLPTDRYFRKAWIDNGKIEIDMNKAREVHMDKIRELRDEKLKELDIETLKGNDVQAQKQVLRDLPQTIDLSTATTPEELKAIMPSELI